MTEKALNFTAPMAAAIWLVMEAKDSARVTESCQKCSLKGGLFE